MRNNFLRHNLTYHILAALLALALWSYVKTADLASRTDVSKAFSDVALEVRNIATNLQVTSAMPQTITVTIRGLPSAAEQATRQNISAYVDLQNAAEGTGQYAIKVVSPQGLSAIASPSRLEVKLEQVLTVDVGLQTIGDRVVQNDHLLVAGVNPQFVHVTAVRSQLERVVKATVQTDWVRATTGARLSLPVQLLDAGGQEIKGLRIEPSVVEAIVNRFAGKTVDVTVPTEGQLPVGYQLVGVQASPESITLFGPPGILANLQSVSPAPISLNGLTANATISLALVLPDGVLAATTTQVQVTVQIKP